MTCISLGKFPSSLSELSGALPQIIKGIKLYHIVFLPLLRTIWFLSFSFLMWLNYMDRISDTGSSLHS